MATVHATFPGEPPVALLVHRDLRRGGEHPSPWRHVQAVQRSLLWTMVLVANWGGIHGPPELRAVGLHLRLQKWWAARFQAACHASIAQSTACRRVPAVARPHPGTLAREGCICRFRVDYRPARPANGWPTTRAICQPGSWHSRPMGSLQSDRRSDESTAADNRNRPFAVKSVPASHAAHFRLNFPASGCARSPRHAPAPDPGCRDAYQERD